MMDKNIKELINSYQMRDISKDEFIEMLPYDLRSDSDALKHFLLGIIQSKNSEDLEDALTIVWILNKEKEQIEILNQLLLEPWHTRYEEIIHVIQKIKSPNSIVYIKEAMQQRYDYLVSYETGVRQFVNQCGHALQSINTKESFGVIKELSRSKDPVLKDEMLYRLSKIEGRNNYKRNYDIE